MVDPVNPLVTVNAVEPGVPVWPYLSMTYDRKLVVILSFLRFHVTENPRTFTEYGSRLGGKHLLRKADTRQ